MSEEKPIPSQDGKGCISCPVNCSLHYDDMARIISGSKDFQPEQLNQLDAEMRQILLNTQTDICMIARACYRCPYLSFCNKTDRLSCANHRANEEEGMDSKSDTEIMSVLNARIGGECPNNFKAIMQVACNSAEKEWFGYCHSSDDWKEFAEESGIQEDESTWIMKNRAPIHVGRTMFWITQRLPEFKRERKEAMGELKACQDCPEDKRKKCLSDIPEDSASFPHSYLREALHRGLLGYFR